MNHPALRKWDSPLRAQTDSGLPTFRFLERDKVQCKSVQIVCSLQTAVRENCKLRFHLWLNEISILPCDLLSANRCMFEPLRASPPNVKPGIHKGAASDGVHSVNSIYAPSRAGTLILKTASAVFYLFDRRSIAVPQGHSQYSKNGRKLPLFCMIIPRNRRRTSGCGKFPFQEGQPHPQSHRLR